MASRRVDNAETSKPRRTRAISPEARENQLVALAYDEAERQIKSGEASSQIISHFLKIGSTREKLEKQLIAENVEVQKAKREAMAAAQRIEQVYSEALDAMRQYNGQVTQAPQHDKDIYEA